jgi:hypothetical protein
LYFIFKFKCGIRKIDDLERSEEELKKILNEYDILTEELRNEIYTSSINFHYPIGDVDEIESIKPQEYLKKDKEIINEILEFLGSYIFQGIDSQIRNKHLLSRSKTLILSRSKSLMEFSKDKDILAMVHMVEDLEVPVIPNDVSSVHYPIGNIGSIKPPEDLKENNKLMNEFPESQSFTRMRKLYQSSLCEELEAIVMLRDIKHRASFKDVK